MLLQTKICFKEYSSNFDLNYDDLQPVTHALLRKFYNGFILHKRYIEQLIMHQHIHRNHKAQLNTISEELDKNIAHLYHVVSFDQCFYNIIMK